MSFKYTAEIWFVPGNKLHHIVFEGAEAIQPGADWVVVYWRNGSSHYFRTAEVWHFKVTATPNE